MPEPDAATAVPDGPLVWHPVIRGLAWGLDWALYSLCAGAIWEFAVTDGLRGGLTFARGALILLGLALLTVALFLVDLWSGLGVHAFRNFERRIALPVFAVESLAILALLAPYLWFTSLLLRWAWAPLRGWGAARDLGTAADGPLPPWFAWGLLLLGAAVVWRGRSQFRHLAINIRNAIRLLGFGRAIRGVLLMSFLRLRLPRKDFFRTCPVISWIPVLALCVVLHVMAGPLLLRWLLPALLMLLVVPTWIDVVMPPTWLFLGKSDFDSFAAFYRLRQTWRQHGLTLLDRVGQQGTQFYDAWRRSLRLGSMFYNPAVARIWSLRTRPAMWEHTVLLLMDYVPVIVADVRGDSDIVREELVWLTEPERAAKAWYLVGEDAQGAVVPPTHVELPAHARVATVQMLLAAEWSPAGIKVIDEPGIMLGR